jgi:hypothetical protein
LLQGQLFINRVGKLDYYNKNGHNYTFQVVMKGFSRPLLMQF